MAEADFAALSRFITQAVGIKLPPSKRTMLEARLDKRLKALELGDFQQYRNYLFSDRGMAEELPRLAEAVATHTTQFFREPRHFQYIADRVLPELSAAGCRRVRTWSAGCSSGEEPYTLAMVLAGIHAAQNGPDFSILATDISEAILRKAMRGMYPETCVSAIPPALRRQCLLRGKGDNDGTIRVAPELRRRIRFGRLNLTKGFQLGTCFEMIFCRNVVIYFDRPTQQRLFSQLCEHLIPDGWLFIGHSESLTGMDLPVRQVAPAIYRKTR